MEKESFVTESFGPSEKLYKYYSNIGNAFKTISNGKIHLDDPKEYNDPFEAIFTDASGGSKYKISCFCEIWSSILMWSYYANCHKGVCIEFDVKKLKKDKNLIYECLKPVHYSSVRPKCDDTVPEDRARGLLSKSEVWEHEHEWRLVCETNEEFCDFDCVSAIYFGVRTDFSQKNVKELIAHADRKAIPIYRCELDASEYRLIKNDFA